MLSQRFNLQSLTVCSPSFLIWPLKCKSSNIPGTLSIFGLLVIVTMKWKVESCLENSYCKTTVHSVVLEIANNKNQSVPTEAVDVESLLDAKAQFYPSTQFSDSGQPQMSSAEVFRFLMGGTLGIISSINSWDGKMSTWFGASVRPMGVYISNNLSNLYASRIHRIILSTTRSIVRLLLVVDLPTSFSPIPVIGCGDLGD